MNSELRENYLFNSSINGIEDSDFIFIIGSNPRFEATMLNARIRKAYLKNKIKIYSISNPGDLTYDYKIIGNNTDDIRKFLNKETKERNNKESLINFLRKKIFISNNIEIK